MKEAGRTILLVEQKRRNLLENLRECYTYVLELGQVVLDGKSEDINGESTPGIVKKEPIWGATESS